jgi:tetratricopeptide (TPR) repeat protein
VRFFNQLAVAALTLAMILAGEGCSRTPEQRYQRFLDSGKKLLAARDSARAILQFQNAIREMPKQGEGYYQLGLAYLQGNRDMQRAAAALQRAVELNPQDSRAQVRLAELMVSTRNAELSKDAESRIRKVLLANPGDLDALFVLAATQVQLGKPEEAEAYLREVLEKSPKELKASLALAQMKLSQKDFHGAERVLRDAADRIADSPDAAAALGTFYAATGKLDDAERWLRQALRQDPKNAPALVRLGALELKAGRKEEAEATYKQIANLPRPEFKAAYGVFLMQQNRRDAAVAEFERLAKEEPGNRVARTRLVAAYAAAGRWASAESLLNGAIQKNDKDLDALLQRGQVYLRSGRFSEAQGDFETVIRFEPSSAEAHFLLAKVYRSRNEELHTKTELGEALRLDPALLAARIEMVQTLLNANSAKAAIGVLNEAPEGQKRMRVWEIENNWALIGNGDLAQARKGVDRILAVEGRTADGVTQDGVLKLASGDVAGARSDFEEVLKNNPGDVRALGLLAQSYSLHNQQAAGTERLRPYAAGQLKSAPVQMLWANWLSGTGNTAGARQALALAKAADPKHLTADLQLARLDIREGKPVEAEKTLTALLAAEPNNVQAHILLGTIEVNSRDEEAIQHFQKVLEVDSANLSALNNLAFLLARDGAHLDEALKYARMAKELAPQESYVQDTMGWVYFRKGLYEMAVKELEGALEKSARSSVKFHLGMTYLKMGNQKGRALVAEALKAEPALAQTETWK